MPDDRGVNDARDRSRRAGRFMQRLGEIAPLDEIGEPLEELADVDGGAMQIEEPLGENSDGNDAASQDGPHQQAALLDVVDHADFVLAAFAARGKPGAGRHGATFRLVGVGVGLGAVPGVLPNHFPGAHHKRSNRSACPILS